MSEKTLKLDNVIVNKKEFHGSKGFNFKFHGSKGFKYFIGYTDNNIIRPLCIVLPEISRYIKCFEKDGKNLCSKIEDDNLLVNYNEVWNKVKKIIDVKFHSKL